MKLLDTFTEIVKRLFHALTDALSKNLGWKILSLVIAVMLWFAVINITNPKEVWPFTVRLIFEGETSLEAQNVVVKNQKALENTPISIKIRGNRLDLEELNKAKADLVAAANLGVIYDFSLTGEVLAPIDIKIPALTGISSDAFEVISISPKYARLTLEEIITEERHIKVMTKGEVKEGYVALTPEISPDRVELTGPVSKLRLIDSVVIETELNSDTSDFSATLPIRLLDRDLKDVEGVSSNTNAAHVTMQINKYKKVPVSASYVGEPTEGYIVTGIQWSPQDLELVGNDADIDSFKAVKLPAVNVSGVTETNTTSFDIRNLSILPESISIKNGSTNTVTITVFIEEVVNKELVLPISMLQTSSMAKGYSYNIDESAVTLTVQGTESAISKLDDKAIRMTVDFTGYSIGEYDVPIKVALPVGISLSGEEPRVRVKVQPVQREPEVQPAITEVDENEGGR